MRSAWILVTLVACGGPATYRPPQTAGEGDYNAAELSFDDEYKPTYGKAELDKALIAERGAEASAERAIAEDEAAGDSIASSDQLRVAVADLAVRRRFITALESCRSSGRTCPPRLDDPAFPYDYGANNAPIPMETPQRFDLESWRKLAAELHGRACACRTIHCVDAVGVAIDELENKPMPDVQGEEVSSLSITRARQCSFRLRGRR